MKNKATRLGIIIIGILAVLAAGGITISTFMKGGSGKLAFSKTMVKETIVNQVCDIEEFVENPEGKTLRLTATYTDESGANKNYITAGLTFKPTQIGEARITVEATDGEKIETTIEVIEAAPTVVTTEEAEYEWKTTITLDELKNHVVYKSVSEPEFHVTTAEYMDQKFEFNGEEEFTFDEVGTYVFSFELSNRGGTVTGQLNVESYRALTANEENDLTNNSSVFVDSHAQLTISDEHAENSDWSWQIKAFASDTYNDPNGGYFKNQVKIDFGREIDASQYYFTMDIKPSKDSMGVAIHYLTEGNEQSAPMGFHDGLGEWNRISSQEKIKEGKYTGILIVLIHQQEEGTYDPEKVTCLIDNLYLHQYPDPNAPIIVGGVEDYDITTSKVSWGANGSTGDYQMPFVEFNKDYTNQTMTFTTKIDTSKKPALIIGARMDGAAIGYGDNSGLMVGFYDGFIEIYGPKFGTWLKAEVLQLESGKEYTFAYSVETVNGQDTFYLKVTDAKGSEIMNYALPLAKGTVNAKGSFVVWHPADNVSISYSEPQTVSRRQNINVVVPADGKAGVAGLSTSVADSITSSAYLAMDGKYTTETFTFTTKIADGTKPNLLIGARMKGIDTLPGTYEGITVQFYYNAESKAGFYEVYAPLHGKWIGADSLTLQSGKEYTFNVSMKGKQFNLIVEQGDNIIHDRTFEIAVDVPANGKFMVWTMNESQEISYEMPVNKEKAENKNVVVENVDAAGNAQLSTVVPNSATSASYLALKGKYADETFTFTTTIADAEKPNLIIGARMAGVDTLPNTYDGITVQFYNGFYEVYGLKHGQMLYEGSAAACSLETGKKYTFSVEVKDDKLTIVVENEGNVVHKQSFAIPDDKSIPTSGSFMVWNMDAERTIAYEKPEVIIPRPTKVTITELRNDYIVNTDGTGVNAMYLITDVQGSASTWKFHRTEDVMIYNDVAQASDTCWAGANVIYVQTYFQFKEYGAFTIPAGYQFTVEGDDTVYEIAEEKTWYYYEGSLHTEAPVIPDEPIVPDEPVETTKVTITGTGASDATYKTINLVTDITGPGGIWKFDNETAVKYNETDKAYPLGWVANNVLQLITSGTVWGANDEIILEAGTQFTIEGVVYELAKGYQMTYNGSSWSGATYEEPVAPTKVIITGAGASDANGKTINLVTDIAGPGAIWKFDNETETKYNAADASYPLGWVANNVLQLITSGRNWAANDTIILLKGTQFTIEDVVYELAQGYKLTYDGSAWSGETVVPVPVAITGVGAAGNPTINLVTDIVGLGPIWKFDDSIKLKYNMLPVKFPLGWVANNVLQLITSGQLWSTNDTIQFEKGTQFMVKETNIVYEIVCDFRMIYSGNSWTKDQ